MREMQERSQDRQSDLVAFRAKRSYEDAERQFREKELKNMEAKRKKIEDFVNSNKRQKLDKELVLAEQANANQEEFKKIIERQIDDINNEEKKKQDKKRLLMDHNFELRRQIKEKEESDKLSKREFLEEGRKIKQNSNFDANRLEEIRKNKIQHLKDLNIEDKYIVDL